MNEMRTAFKPLFQLQRVMWLLFTLAYAAITVLYMVGASFAIQTAVWTTIALLALTGAKLLFIGSYFQRSGLKRHLVLTVLLALVLLSVALLEIIE